MHYIYRIKYIVILALIIPIKVSRFLLSCMHLYR